MYTRQGSGSMDEFVKTLDGRIQAMATAHSLLSENRWQGVGLSDLVRLQLAPYATDANMITGGPDVVLTAAATQAVAMVLHELVTNAGKFGSLSTAAGRVSMTWDCSPDGIAAPMLSIIWREIAGPPITAPVQSGFGASLIRDLIPHEIGGKVDLAFQPEGAFCKIEFPLAPA
jgi:two-component sensor histidine kinase